MGEGQSSIFKNDWIDFVDRDHSIHIELIREKLEYTFLSMQKCAIQSRIPFTIPPNVDADQVLYSYIVTMMKNQSVDVSNQNHIVDDPPRKEDVEEKVPDTTFVSDIFL